MEPPNVAEARGRQQMLALLDLVTGRATRLLADDGRFPPLGYVMTTAGDCAPLRAVAQEGQHVTAADLLSALLEVCREAAREGTIRACAICYRTRAGGPEGRPAAAVILEHRDAPPMMVVRPYSRGPDGKWAFETGVTDRGERQVFL
jgi:hypothetical protein